MWFINEIVLLFNLGSSFTGESEGSDLAGTKQRWLSKKNLAWFFDMDFYLRCGC